MKASKSAEGYKVAPLLWTMKHVLNPLALPLIIFNKSLTKLIFVLRCFI